MRPNDRKPSIANLVISPLCTEYAHRFLQLWHLHHFHIIKTFINGIDLARKIDVHTIHSVLQSIQSRFYATKAIINVFETIFHGLGEPVLHPPHMVEENFGCDADSCGFLSHGRPS